ncbi:MAG: hypothetical protein M3R68_04955 [Acidobacteriota bacterium]|nr:hypothetical protein [Acidobacteriota bacterium]
MRLLILFGTIALLITPAIGLGQNGRSQPSTIESNSSAWQEFSSDKGRYSVLMPGRPTAKTISIPIEGLQINMYMQSLKTTIRYSVSYYDLPVKVEDPDEIKKFLLNTKRGGISGIHGRLLEDREIKLGMYQGYYVTLLTPDDSVLRSKSFLVGQRFYQVTINTPKEPVPGKSRFFQEVATRFLDSFKLTSQDQ